MRVSRKCALIWRQWRRTITLATLLLTGFGGSAIAQITGQPSIGQPQQQSPQLNQQQRLQPLAPLATSSSATYLLGAGDQISLSVIGYPEFTGTVAILTDGTITLTLLGPLRVSGLTPSQLSAALTYWPGSIQLSGLSRNNIEALGATSLNSTNTNSRIVVRRPLPAG